MLDPRPGYAREHTPAALKCALANADYEVGATGPYGLPVMVYPAENAQPPTQRGVILERGQTIDRFVILGLLGRGGMGEVYAAYDPELDRKIAIKVLRARNKEGADPLDARTRLLREAQAIAKLSHPNVVVVFDVGTLGEGIFLAMEFVDGHTLSYWLHAQRRSWREVLAMFLAAGRGLAAAHGAGIVHRDFKPDNVMVGKEGHVRVMDFGLARQIDDKGATPAPVAPGQPASPPEAAREPLAETFDPSWNAESTARVGGGKELAAQPTSSGRYLRLKLTQTGAMLGTPAYMAPEQFVALAGDARTDQFSFCVALHEGLYGERPFKGDSLASLMASVTTGSVPEPPASTRVPGWIRRVLLRGLAKNPADRFPSMNALLAALETDPNVRARRVVAAVAALACVGLAAAGARRGLVPADAPCRGGAQLLAGVWEAGPAPSARKDAIGRAFMATGKSYAAQAFAGAGKFLTAYADRWLGMYRDSCEATHVRGEQSAEVMDLRMSCLRERLTGVRALTDVFAVADGAVVENAISAASALPSIDRCADVALLKAVVKPPEDEATRKRVDVLRGDLARLRALADAGQCAQAVDLGGRLIPQIRATSYLPLLAEGLVMSGRLSEVGCREERGASEEFREAYFAALTSRDDEVAAEAATRLAGFLVGNVRYEPAAAREWMTTSRAMIARIGGKPLYEAWLLQVDGVIARRENRLADSLTALRRSQALKEQALGKDHPDLLRSLNTLGLSLEAAGRTDEALATFVSARVGTERMLGRDHPTAALWAVNEGEVLNLLGRHAEARAVFQRSIDTLRRAGSDPFFVAYSLTGLGVAYLGEGRSAEAVPVLEEALQIRIDRHVDAERLGEVRFALARALWDRPASRARARTLGRQALADYAQVSQPDGPVPDVAAWLKARAI